MDDDRVEKDKHAHVLVGQEKLAQAERRTLGHIQVVIALALFLIDTIFLFFF